MRGFKKLCCSLYVAAIVSVIVYIVMRFSKGFAEFINSTVSAATRWITTQLSDLVPFSIVEMTVLALPVLVTAVVVWLIVRVKRRGAAGARRVVAVLLAVLSFFAVTFVFNGAPGYFGRSVGEKLGFTDDRITTDELTECVENLVYEINNAADGIAHDSTGATKNLYSIGETSRKISELYDLFRDRYGFPQSFVSNPKLLITSPLVTYTHISGLYSGYTGEININTNYPDFVIVSTVAHEMAHQRGIAPEDGANFMAYAVLRESDDNYLRYAGALDAYMTVSSYLYRADPSTYRTLMARLCDTAKADLVAYSKFFDKYRESKAAEINEKINDAYLVSQGTSGTVSYDEATIYIVKYQSLIYPD